MVRNSSEDLSMGLKSLDMVEAVINCQCVNGLDTSYGPRKGDPVHSRPMCGTM